MAAFDLDPGNRHANRIVNPRILADQPHGSGLRLVTFGGPAQARDKRCSMLASITPPSSAPCD